MIEFIVPFLVTLGYIAMGVWSTHAFIARGFGVIKKRWTADDPLPVVFLAIVWPISWCVYWGRPAFTWLRAHPPHTWTTHEGPAPEPQPLWYADQHGGAVDPAQVLPPMAPKDVK